MKKQLLLRLARALGLYREVTWQATDALEADQIHAWFGADAVVHVVPNLPSPGPPEPQSARHKVAGTLRLLFVGRISRMKNLLGALHILDLLSIPVEYDVYGPIEDEDYYQTCRHAANRLPPHVRVTFKGAVDHGEVSSLMTAYDLLFVPTLGENFGHVIIEAFRAGLPVLISDRTPWRGLTDFGAGWDLPLTEPGSYRRVLEECAMMGETQMSALREKAREFGLAAIREDDVVNRYVGMFSDALHTRVQPSSWRNVSTPR